MPKRTLTANGHELTFQGNHLAMVLLQRLLNDLVLGTPGSRVIVTSSDANRRGRVNLEDLDREWIRYRAFATYATTKLENILFVRELARRFAGSSSVAMAVHPGSVATAFGAGSFFPGFFYKMPGHRAYLRSPESGAAPLVWLATMPHAEAYNGVYFDRFKAAGNTSPQADDPELARGLWEVSEEDDRPGHGLRPGLESAKRPERPHIGRASAPPGEGVLCRHCQAGPAPLADSAQSDEGAARDGHDRDHAGDGRKMG